MVPFAPFGPFFHQEPQKRFWADAALRILACSISCILKRVYPVLCVKKLKLKQLPSPKQLSQNSVHGPGRRVGPAQQLF